jgi:hypothetical protein
MTATNHVLTGIVISATVSNPAIGLPLAFMAHFALDSLPHFDIPAHQHTSKKFLYVLGSDMTVASTILFTILLLQPAHWQVLIAGGVLCASPDLMWLPRWINELKSKPNKPKGPIARFHSKIQRYAHPDRWDVEAAWFVVFGWLALHLV